MNRRILPWVGWVALIAHTVHVPATPLTGCEIKAGYLLNFVEFVEWPSAAFADHKSPVVVGVMGQDPFGGELDKLQGKVIKSRKLQIRRFKGALEFRGEETPGRRQDNLARKQARKLAELKSCHILFISPSERNHLPMILKSLKGASVLTVSEMEAFTREGGIINFLNDGDRPFEINQDAADRARLKISSKLLSLAKIVRIDRSNGTR